MPISLLYVSTSLLPPSEEETALADIIAVARSRNADLDVTGALVFTRRHFAQLLEGEAAALQELMTSIRRDRRHSDLNVVGTVAIAERRFASWSMAYAGPSTYVDRHIVPLLPQLQEAGKRATATERLITLMRHFVDEGWNAGSFEDEESRTR